MTVITTINNHLVIRKHGQILVRTGWGETTEFAFDDEEQAADFCRMTDEQIRAAIREEAAYAADAHNCYSNAAYTDDGAYGPGEYCDVCGRKVSSPPPEY